MSEVSSFSPAVVVVKMQAKQLFQSYPPKQLTTHPLMTEASHLILVRDTKAALTSHLRALRLTTNIPSKLSREQTGIPQLGTLHRALNEANLRLTVVDTDDICRSPRDEMFRLAKAVGIPFNDGMIRWEKVAIPPPPWGTHWYDDLMSSRGWRSVSDVSNDVPSCVQEFVVELGAVVDSIRDSGTLKHNDHQLSTGD